jgi:ribosomal protein S18 acetylase RimI-like enzyme
LLQRALNAPQLGGGLDKKGVDTKSMKTSIGNFSLDIHPTHKDDLDVILEVYKQCEDFLELGPVPTASISMVLKDIENSIAEGGNFCGIYTADGKMIGILDYVPSNYKGEPHTAFLELLMIAASYRKQGIGKAVVEAFENEVTKNKQVRTILSGVQVNNPQAEKFWRRNGYRIVSGPELMPDQTTAFGLRKDFG